jgi:hypothetical protein
MKNFLGCLGAIVFASMMAACSAPTSAPVASKPEVSDFAVENVHVVKEYNNAWTLKGMVRNNSGHAASIAVRVKFLNAQGDVLYATKAVVNDWDPVASGKAAVFSYATDPKDFDGVTDYDVQPYER